MTTEPIQTHSSSEASPLTAEVWAGLDCRVRSGCGYGCSGNVSDLLDGHVSLNIECLDRIYLHGYVPNLQVGGQVVSFMTRIWGC